MPRPKSNLSETVFVRYQPPNPAVTHGLLTTAFSEYGPVKKCSVIRDQKPGGAATKGDDDTDDDAKRTRGYGFVRFAAPEDAAEAVARLHGTYLAVGECGDRVRLFVERASDAATAPVSTGGKDQKGGKKKIGGDNKASQEEPAKHGDGGEDRHDDQPQEPQGHQVDEVMARRKRTARIIVRNLAFSAKVSHIRTAMESSFGGPDAVVDVHLPLVPGGRGGDTDKDKDKSGKGKGGGKGGKAAAMHRGFAFVTFDSAVQAAKAVEVGSLTIKGREVAMDYSVSKFQHRRMAQEEEEEEEEEEKQEEEEHTNMEEGGAKEDGEGSDGDGSNDDDGTDDGNDGLEMTDANDESEADRMDLAGFAGYLAPYALALAASIGVTAAFFKFVLLDY